MRLKSTRESMKAGDPSVLAIAETVLATSFSIWIGLHFGSWWHVAIGASIAPLLLLRTDKSCSQALNWCHGCAFPVIDFFNSRTGKYVLVQIVSLAVLLFVLVVTSVLIRVFATISHALGHPLSAISAIPKNWSKTVLATDSSISPEWMPLPDEEKVFLDTRWPSEALTFFRIYDLVGEMTEIAFGADDDFVGGALAVAVFGPFVAMAFLCATTYRLSIKSTALIWLPIIWALAPVRHGEPVDKYIRLFLRSDLMRFVGLFSVAEIALFVLKYAFFVAEHRLAMDGAAWEPILGERLAMFFVAFARPGQIPLWQVGATVNAVLFVIAYLWARSLRNRAEEGIPLDGGRVDRTFGALLQVRRLFTSYAIACNLYAAVQLAKRLPVPSFGSRVFPWV